MVFENGAARKIILFRRKSRKNGKLREKEKLYVYAYTAF